MTTKDDELLELRSSNQEFLKHNPAAPALIGQFRDIYMVRLLEHLVGDAKLDIQYAHERFIAEQIGAVDLAQNRAKLAVAPEAMQQAAKGGFPIHEGRTTRMGVRG